LEPSKEAKYENREGIIRNDDVIRGLQHPSPDVGEKKEVKEADWNSDDNSRFRFGLLSNKKHLRAPNKVGGKLPVASIITKTCSKVKMCN